MTSDYDALECLQWMATANKWPQHGWKRVLATTLLTRAEAKRVSEMWFWFPEPTNWHDRTCKAHAQIPTLLYDRCQAQHGESRREAEELLIDGWRKLDKWQRFKLWEPYR